jgi:hypothetical protein
MVFPFLGGIVLMLSLLLDVTALAPIAILLEIVGLVIFLVRMWPSIRAVDWMEASAGRHGVLAAASIIFVIGLAQYFVIKYEGDFDLVPTNQLLALDHTQFIGAVTNAVFAMLLAATVRRGDRLDHLIFVAINAGLVGFAAGLLFDVTALKRVFAPIMGAGLLAGLGLYAYRLAGSSREPAAPK